MRTRFVLDAWAILALLQGEEPAASRVKELLEQASRGRIALSISIINLGEVIYRIGKEKGEKEADATLGQLRRLPMTVLPASEEAVFAAVRFKMHYTISYADAFAAAATEALDATLVSGDPELMQLERKLAIEKLSRRE
jgi:predicted nucleic acid-binding protein